MKRGLIFICSLIIIGILGFVYAENCDNCNSPYYCVDGKFCINDTCTPGTRMCSSVDGYRVCSTQGQWGNELACSSGECNHSNGDCVADCTPGERRCSSTIFGLDAYQICSKNGDWDVANLRCPKGNLCKNGFCVFNNSMNCDNCNSPYYCVDGKFCINDTCTPGTRMCSSVDGYRVCSTQGQWGNEISCSSGKCDNSNGNCVSEMEIGSNETNRLTEIDRDKGICNGCLLDTKCYPLGFRKEKTYCDDNSSTFLNQKVADSLCMNNFECDSNICASDKCVNGSLLQKIFEWFSHLFGK